MLFDYDNLYAQMGKQHYTINKLALEADLSWSTLNRKLKGTPFNQKEIVSICKILKIPKNKINYYFFKPKVQKTKQTT